QTVNLTVLSARLPALYYLCGHPSYWKKNNTACFKGSFLYFQSDETACCSIYDGVSTAGINAIYAGQCSIENFGDLISGNSEIKQGSKIALEVNLESDPRTLIFFVVNVQQKNYITHIRASIRFWAYFFIEDSSFKVTQFERITEPTKRDEKSDGWLWAAKWKEKPKKCEIQ
ncbi:MAG: hypothetical protein EZS28_033128, partial [Streblomastix strix]